MGKNICSHRTGVGNPGPGVQQILILVPTRHRIWFYQSSDVLLGQCQWLVKDLTSLSRCLWQWLSRSRVTVRNMYWLRHWWAFIALFFRGRVEETSGRNQHRHSETGFGEGEIEEAGLGTETELGCSQNGVRGTCSTAGVLVLVCLLYLSVLVKNGASP